MKKILSIFEVFKFRDFRLLTIGMFISFIGTQMQIVGVSWHLYQLTKSAASLGFIGLAGFIPVMVFSPFAGVIVDAVDRKKLLMWNQILFGGLTLLFAFLTLFHFENPWIIYTVLFLSATLVTIDLPARQTIIPSIIPKPHLVRAFSIYSMSRQTSIILGPTIAGLIISLYGVSLVYFANAISFFIFLLLLFFIPIPKNTEKATIHMSSIVEGIQYIQKSPLLRAMMILDFFANFFAASTVIFPIFATEILHTGARGLGLLYAAPSIGAVIAGFFSGSLYHIKHQGKLLLIAVGLYGCATIGFGLSHNLLLSLTYLAIVGGADMISVTVRSTLAQVITPDSMRGRMNAINMMFFAGGPFLGEAEAGFVAALLGAPLSVIAGGLGAIASVAGVGFFVPQLVKYENKEK